MKKHYFIFTYSDTYYPLDPDSIVIETPDEITDDIVKEAFIEIHSLVLNKRITKDYLITEKDKGFDFYGQMGFVIVPLYEIVSKLRGWNIYPLNATIIDFDIDLE